MKTSASVCRRLGKGADEATLPGGGHTFDLKFEKDVRQVHRAVQRLLSVYKDEKRGPTFIAVQSPKGQRWGRVSGEGLARHSCRQEYARFSG